MGRSSQKKWMPCLSLLVGIFLFAFSGWAAKAVALTADELIDQGEHKQGLGDLEGALVDYDQALSLISNEGKSADAASMGAATVQRETVLMAKGDYDLALTDFLKVQTDNVTGNIGIGDEECNIWLIRVSKGQKALADQELTKRLSEVAKAMANLEMEIRTCKYFLGKVSEADLVAFAKREDLKSPDKNDHENEGETWYFIGMKHLVTGDLVSAKKDFKKIFKMKNVMFNTVTLATAGLKKIK